MCIHPKIGSIREVLVPGSGRKVRHDPLPRIGVGISRLGTSEAVAVGAYAYAIGGIVESAASAAAESKTLFK